MQLWNFQSTIVDCHFHEWKAMPCAFPSFATSELELEHDFPHTFVPCCLSGRMEKEVNKFERSGFKYENKNYWKRGRSLSFHGSQLY